VGNEDEDYEDVVENYCDTLQYNHEFDEADDYENEDNWHAFLMRMMTIDADKQQMIRLIMTV